MKESFTLAITKCNKILNYVFKINENCKLEVT